MAHPTQIASHRGGLFLWPENSARAFRETARLAVEQAECDVHLTSDGEVVVHHDATLERMTDGVGPVVARSAAELAALRVKGTAGEAPPTLAEYLAILSGTPVAPRIEIKADAERRADPGIVPKVTAALDAPGDPPMERVFRNATRPGGLFGAMRTIRDGAHMTSQLLADGPKRLRDLGVDGAIAVARSYGFPEIGMHERLLDAGMLARFRAAGLGVGVWGANHAPSIKRMLELRVDLFATDDPPLAIDLRNAG